MLSSSLAHIAKLGSGEGGAWGQEGQGSEGTEHQKLGLLPRLVWLSGESVGLWTEGS